MINFLKKIFHKEKYKKYNHFFDKKVSFLRLEDIVFLTKSEIYVDYDFDKKIYDITTLKKANSDTISFLTNKKYIEDLKNTKAAAVFVTRDIMEKVPEGIIPIVTKNPHFAYTQCLSAMIGEPLYYVKPGISRKANIARSAKIGKCVEIQSGAYIGKNVQIGKGCKICANAVINDDCIIGDNTFIGPNATISFALIGKECIINNGAQIGQSGFGFAHHEMFNHRIPQVGKVVIGDFVEIGSCTCVDRGAFDDTVIGANTKIDNLVQIAHGVKVGMGTFIAGCACIAGSTEVGRFVQLGGNSSVAGHLKIADAVQIAGHSGIAKTITEPKTIWGGAPAMPDRRWKRLIILQEKMVELKKKNDEIL